MRKETIPVEFVYSGKKYKGALSAPYGPDQKVWHLTIDGFTEGRLMHTEKYGWQFFSHKEKFKILTDFFSGVVTSWNR